MKKKVIKTEKKLSLEKFKVAELKNMKMIVGGDGIDINDLKTITTKGGIKNL
jgi:hypothetical protein